MVDTAPTTYVPYDPEGDAAMERGCIRELEAVRLWAWRVHRISNDPRYLLLSSAMEQALEAFAPQIIDSEERLGMTDTAPTDRFNVGQPIPGAYPEKPSRGDEWPDPQGQPVHAPFTRPADTAPTDQQIQMQFKLRGIKTHYRVEHYEADDMGRSFLEAFRAGVAWQKTQKQR